MSASTQAHLMQFQVSRTGATGRRSGVWQTFRRTIRRWRSRLQERRTFAALDSRDLRDLGLSQWDVEREIARPFWRD